MTLFLTICSTITVLFFFMHELDATKYEEWKMFKFLRPLKERTQYLVFLYYHIPLTVFFFFYLLTVYNASSLTLFIIVNSFGILHTCVHLIALRWNSNVFTKFESFLFIGMIGISALINLVFIKQYSL